MKKNKWGFNDDFMELQDFPPVIEYEYWQLSQKRKLVINQEIDESIIDNVGIYIMKWNDEDIDKSYKQPIHIYINTNGGELQSTMGLISMIKNSKTPVYTYVLGKAYSAGALIFLAGHKRFVHEYSSILIHEGTMFEWNSTSKVKEAIKFSEKQEQIIKDFICNRTKINPKLYDTNYKTEWYFTSEEALEYGLAHEIIGVDVP